MTYKAINNPKGAGFIVGMADDAEGPYVAAPGSPVFHDADEADWCAYLTAAGAACPGHPTRMVMPSGNYGGRRD